MPGYLSNLIRNGARPVASLRRASPLPAATLPLRVAGAERPAAEDRRLATHAPLPQPTLAPPAEPFSHVAPAASYMERIPPEQAEPAPPRVESAPPVAGIEAPSPRSPAAAGGGLPRRQAPAYLSSPVAAGPAPPRVGSALPAASIEEAASSGLSRRQAPVDLSSPVAAGPSTPSIPQVKPAPIPVPHIEFSSLEAPISDRRSLRPAPVVTTALQPELPRSPAPERTLSAPLVARDVSTALPAASSSRPQPPSPASPKPLLSTARSEQPLSSQPLPARSLDVMRPTEISVREDIRHRQLPTRAPEEPRLIIQRLDIQIINEVAPVRRRPDTHPPAAPRAESDPLRLDRRHVRHLL